MSDRSAEIAAAVQDAADREQSLYIQGGGSKGFYGRDVRPHCETLDLSQHSGVVNYEPTELVLTVRAGTPIDEITHTLAGKNQCLPFDPPGFAGKATIGGTLACGFSGPGRPYAGAARDHVLGTDIVNGRGELLHFGGEVMKNVAGYDVARLMTGAMGTLGVITQASLKVLPRPQTEVTLAFEQDSHAATVFMYGLGNRPLPVSAACHYQGRTMIRLSGSEAGVESASRSIGGEPLPNGSQFWHDLRDFNHAFFQSDQPLWRISLPPLATVDLAGEIFIDWGGQQCWLRSDQAAAEIRLAVTKAGGHATLFRGGDRMSDVFHPLTPAMSRLQNNIRLSFDPKGILNTGIQYTS